MIIRCHVCNADSDGRWKSPPAMIFCDPYWGDGSKRKGRPRARCFRVRLPRPFIGEAGKRDSRAGGGPLEEGRAAMNAAREGGEVIGWCDIRGFTHRRTFGMADNYGAYRVSRRTSPAGLSSRQRHRDASDGAES
jgi:hypothetical protein